MRGERIFRGLFFTAVNGTLRPSPGSTFAADPQPSTSSLCHHLAQCLSSTSASSNAVISIGRKESARWIAGLRPQIPIGNGYLVASISSRINASSPPTSSSRVPRSYPPSPRSAKGRLESLDELIMPSTSSGIPSRSSPAASTSAFRFRWQDLDNGTQRCMLIIEPSPEACMAVRKTCRRNFGSMCGAVGSRVSGKRSNIGGSSTSWPVGLGSMLAFCISLAPFEAILSNKRRASFPVRPRAIPVSCGPTADPSRSTSTLQY
mmetsp:Transcript_27658/g.84314  ORF Transcript_27658/g.84314 Transcript_27658/m.84314 type:complete len:262 (-) Transcript_27658:720-1505(-)